jgi:diguanylate cyclase
MTPRRHATLSWQLALGFTLLSGICALAIGLYVAKAQQHVGANYTALVADVVRAQQHPTLLRSTLMELSETSREARIAQLDNLIWRIPQHIRGVTHGLSESQLEPRGYLAALERLQSVHERIPALQEALDRVAAGGDPAALLDLGHAVEDDLAWAYSDLNELIHRAAGEQRIIMERLAFAIAILVILVLLVVGGLMLALLRLNRQRVRLAHLSRVDALTGLCNRRHLLEVAARLYQSSLRGQRPLSLALMDLDHFKRINDDYGHPAGDRILQVFSRALLEETRQVDVVARLGGEEFCVLMPDTDAQGAISVAERVRKRIEGLPLQQLGIRHPMTISLGVATGTGEGADFDHLYSRADKALYEAKANGRNGSELG